MAARLSSQGGATGWGNEPTQHPKPSCSGSKRYNTTATPDGSASHKLPCRLAAAPCPQSLRTECMNMPGKAALTCSFWVA